MSQTFYATKEKNTIFGQKYDKFKHVKWLIVSNWIDSLIFWMRKKKTENWQFSSQNSWSQIRLSSTQQKLVSTSRVRFSCYLITQLWKIKSVSPILSCFCCCHFVLLKFVFASIIQVGPRLHSKDLLIN